MAKGLRSSTKKSNRTKLRSRVFEPVESARAERIHAKLLELVQQPKPEPQKKADMELDSAEGTILPPNSHHLHTLLTKCDNSATTAVHDTTKDDDYPKGSYILSAKIPHSLTSLDTHIDTSKHSTNPVAKDDCDMRNFLFHLGLSSDIVGFTNDGDLKFAFDPLPQQWLSDHGLTASA